MAIETLSRDSQAVQRMPVPSIIPIGYIVLDRAVEAIEVGEGLVGQAVGLQIAPDCFDGVEFRRISGQPLGTEPMGSLGERGLARLGGVDGAVVEHENDAPVPPRRR